MGVTQMANARVIDQIKGGASGPTLVLVGGVHGNEPAGVEAARAVLSRLRAAGSAVRGEIVALIGNVRALAENRRFLARDLNRMWNDEHVEKARSTREASGEVAELAELAGELEAVLARATGPVFALDLHTTSAEGIPFAVIGATPQHRTFARELPLPGIVGLEEQLDGVLTRWLSAKGCVTMAIEGGQSSSRTAAANLDAVVTLAAAASGVLDRANVPGFDAAREHLLRVRGDLPQLIEVVSRHEVAPTHGFRMEPGFANIQRTTGGTLLARDGRGEIRAPFDGLVLLPLYQPQGSDGFFYGRALSD